MQLKESTTIESRQGGKKDFSHTAKRLKVQHQQNYRENLNQNLAVLKLWKKRKSAISLHLYRGTTTTRTTGNMEGWDRACAKLVWSVSSLEWEKLELCIMRLGRVFQTGLRGLSFKNFSTGLDFNPQPTSFQLATIFLSKYQSPLCASYLDLSFDEGSDVVLILEDGERLQQVVFQPLPVLRDLFTGGSWRRGGRNHQYYWTMAHVFGCYAFTFKHFLARLSCLLGLM